MSITKEEFQVMAGELLGKPIRYDMLCALVERTLKSRVRSWVQRYSVLKRYGTAEDLMHNLHILFMKKTVSMFLLKNGLDKPINDNPDGFFRWLHVVARNYTNSLMKKLSPGLGNEQLIPDDVIEEFFAAKAENTQAGHEALNNAFNAVMAADTKVYKTLTWLAYCCVVAGRNVETHKSSEFIDNRFKDMSLFEMYAVIRKSSECIPWMVFNMEQEDRITSALAEVQEDGRLFGEMLYREFYMKKGGKSSISDWINRMNNIVKRS